jgi:hypothetical protein
MDFGSRSIRTAGAGSGSIEVTLPAALRELLGLPCRIILRDGLRPEIVLKPELRGAHAAFTRLSDLLREAMGLPAGDPPFEEVQVTLQSSAPQPGGPWLAWIDGMALAAPPPHPSTALARSLRGLAEPLALQAGVGPLLAADFAAAVAWLLAGPMALPGELEACDIAAEALVAEGMSLRPPLLPEDGLAPAAWAAARPWLRHLLALHRDWTVNPAQRIALGSAWRRGLALELSGD